MQKINRFHLWLLLGIVFFFIYSCRKNQIIGGIQDIDRYKNTSTYDVLKSNAQYDTLIQLIDSAHLIDSVNKMGTTFFAPNNNAIHAYLFLRTQRLQVNNSAAKFGLDSLIYNLKNNIKGVRDSMGMYFIQKPLTYNMLTNTGEKYPTKLLHDTAIVSYEFTKLGYNALVSTTPQVVYYIHLWHYYSLSATSPASKVPGSVGVRTLCTTSGITTQNGILNALSYDHTLFFYGTIK